MNTAGHAWRKTLVGLTTAALLSACVVDTPGIQNAQTGESTQATPAPPNPDPPNPAPTAVEPPTVAPQFEPTVPPATPTPVPEPTATPIPEPTATPEPVGPPPLPTSAPEAEFAAITVEPGLVAIPVRGVRFMLADARPVLQLGGHTLIYVDDQRMAEVDIFTPAAARDGSTIETYDALIDYLGTDEAFTSLLELNAVSIAGFPTRVFEGTGIGAIEGAERAFITDVASADNDQLGWFPPARMRLWVIDNPSGPVIVSAESLEDPGQYSDAVRLATEILSTITFG